MLCDCSMCVYLFKFASIYKLHKVFQFELLSMTAVSPQRSGISSAVQSPHSSSSTTSSSSSIYYDFTIELDKTLSSSQWIEFMKWSQNMDVIALIMHQSNNDTQHLWLQRCVGKWQNLLNIDLSQELDDSNIRVISLSWRYDGNGVCLGLSNGEMMQFLIENGTKNSNDKIQTKDIHKTGIRNIKWIMDKYDDRDKNEEEVYIDHEHKHYDDENIDASNYDNVDNLFGADNNINDINAVMQNNEALLSCTQLNPTDYGYDQQEKDNEYINIYNANNQILNSSTFLHDETNKFLSKIPSLPKPPRINFRYKLDNKQNTLQYLMKKQSIPPIPRKFGRFKIIYFLIY